MGSRRMRWAARTVAVTAAVAVVGASPGAAQAATEYDGDATALRIEGLQLELFPNGTEGLPPQLRQAIKELQSQAPEQLQRSSLTVAIPDQTIGHVEFPGTATEGALPPNPLIAAEVLPAKSIKLKNGNVLSEAGITDLSLGGGVLSANVIKSRCVGDGETLTAEVSQVRLKSNQDIIKSGVTLKPGTEVPITGIGTLKFNEVSGDRLTNIEATNLVLDLDSNLSLDELGNVFEDISAVRKAANQILTKLGKSEVGGEGGLDQVTNQLKTALDEVAKPVEDGGNEAAEQILGATPQQVKDALNNLAHLDGTITIANAACSQAPVSQAAQPQEPAEAAPAQPVADTNEPPLADTGSPAGMVGIGLAGIAALGGGVIALTRLRRKQA